MSVDGESRFTIRSLAPSVFIPTIVYEIGNGAVVPVLALTALELGASPAVAGVVVAVLGLGQLLGTVPSAALIDRLGDRKAMIIAAVVAGAGMVASYLAGHLVVLACATALVGASNAAFYLARQSFVTLVVPASSRAATMSTLAGTHRIGLFLGPFVGAGAIQVADLRAAFLVGVAAALVTVAVLVVAPEPPLAQTIARRPRETASVVTVWREHGRLLSTLGMAVFAIGAVRSARSTVVPLWADHIGLDAQTTSVIFGISAAIDMALFYPAGRIMDRFGRLWIAVPSMVLLGGSMIVVPLTSGLVSLAVVTLIMGAGNGLGSGIVMTLGADVAPRDATVRFLSLWRLMSDCGHGGGPLLIAALATWSLGGAIVGAGVVGLLAAAAVARWAPRWSPYATAAMVRA
ncbi:MAG: MFS transporter, partial [Micromonosporaceae bacterium]|nr:MFS transporter [Micromonosporaceae bacterium]